MVEVASYVYVFGPLCWAALAAFGGLIVTLSTQHLRIARGFFIVSAIPMFLVPITFGYVASSAVIGLATACLSAFALGMIYYIGIGILSDHIHHADQDSKSKNS
jgi:hypothetical protein